MPKPKRKWIKVPGHKGPERRSGEERRSDMERRKGGETLRPSNRPGIERTFTLEGEKPRFKGPQAKPLGLTLAGVGKQYWEYEDRRRSKRRSSKDRRKKPQ